MQKEKREEFINMFPHLCSVNGAGTRVTHLHCTLRSRVLCLHTFLLGYWNVLLSLSYFEVHIRKPSLHAQTLFLWSPNSLLRGFCICLFDPLPPQSILSFFSISLLGIVGNYIFLQSGISFSLEKKMPVILKGLAQYSLYSLSQVLHLLTLGLIMRKHVLYILVH